MVFRLEEIRKEKKMSQEELSQKSGISRGTISALENNVQKVTTSKTLFALAEALGIRVDQLFCSEND